MKRRKKARIAKPKAKPGNTAQVSKGTNPASTGPAGSHFEGQVGASFLLSLLVGAEPRGLPGTTIDRVKVQRAAEGHPLDDVIVDAHDAQGHAAVLEVQVKRSITFAPTDPVFRDVVGQIAKVASKPEFLKGRYELAIATAQTSHKIEGPYQTVLTWARQLGDAATFMSRIKRPGSANDAMRSFVSTFRAHLQEAGAPHDETVWRLLSRLQILPFDFTATGSAAAELAKERATRALHPDDTPRAGDLWKALTELSIEIGSSGGDITRDRLVEKLKQTSFRLAEERRSFTALAALAEASRHALADIGDRVGGAMLTRHERVAAVHAALDQGRYVEIRGDAGVGKSAVLKHFAEQISEQARVIVLSPGRTTPKGWLAMRGVLQFDGTARELLVDLAAGGNGVMFLDNLDFFAPEERLTAIDLVREAVRIPGMSVIATARRDFGVVEPSWLPGPVITQLGRAEPVVIDELSESETEELRNAAPQLRALLADSHPARDVARNLFRLSRLANRPADAPALRTEVDMAEQWWQSADGDYDEDHRNRARVLRAFGEQALSRVGPLDAREFPAAAVSALVGTETLRDLGNDRMTFRHDVLRDWAVANLLASDPAFIQRLPLNRPAPADLARGVELATRIAIEHARDSTRWQSFVDALSKAGDHGSWRRAALLALVRSEIGAALLDRTKSYLLDNKAQALRELIRVVMAVEVEPATKRLIAAGLDPKLIPAGFNIPSGPSWMRLITWLLSFGHSLPPAAIPDVVDLYGAWSRGRLGKDPLTPFLVPWLYHWLQETDAGLRTVGVQGRQPFNGEVTGEQISSLREEITTDFLLFCNHAPELAKAHLQALRKNPERERAPEILKFRGALAQAAPEELAELTAEILIPKNEKNERERSHLPPRPFGYRDLDFIPASPAQGPFLELLIHAPEVGLRLVRKLVDHAISFKTGGRDFGTNAMKITSLDGIERTFPWVQSYGWSREMGSDTAVVTSALMALEAWAHQRIEAGEDFHKVLADVLGPANATASYLLVAVDLLLSHWPKSRAAAIPFLGCPELLCIDRQRMPRDNIELPDFLGLKALQKEPVGFADLASLKARPSRRLMLDRLLQEYVFDEKNRKLIVERLQRAAARLGPPKGKSGLLDLAFMTVHALNLLDPKNWQKKTMQTNDGPGEGWEYVSPASESEHFQSLQDEKFRERQSRENMQIQIRAALNDPSLSSPAFAASAVEWAQLAAAKLHGKDGDSDGMRRDTIVIAALVGVRDGGATLIEKHGAWMRETFLGALRTKKDPVWDIQTGLQFNPIAMGFVGIVLLLKNRFALEDVRSLLQSAGDDSPAAAHGFALTAGVLGEIDERLVCSVLRCAFAACVQPRPHWRLEETEAAARSQKYREKVQNAIEAELAWLSGKRDEPAWPPFADDQTHTRDRYVTVRGRRKELVVRPPEPEVRTDHDSPALWLKGAAGVFDVAKRPWLRDVITTYASWTRIMNGSGLNEEDELESPPREWNAAYFKLLAYCLPGLTSAQIDEIALMPIMDTEERAFHEITATFLPDVDVLYFNDLTLKKEQAVHIRSTLAKTLMTGRMWRYHTRDRSISTEIHFGPAVAAALFNDYANMAPPKCYLFPKAIESVDPFLATLKDLAEGGTFLLAAMVLLNLLEVQPRTTHLPLIVVASKSWLAAFPDDKAFWIDQGVGRRLCALIDAVLALDPRLFASDQASRRDIDRLLENLVRLGIAEAYQLEDKLRALQ
jgi:hypothetical protein